MAVNRMKTPPLKKKVTVVQHKRTNTPKVSAHTRKNPAVTKAASMAKKSQQNAAKTAAWVASQQKKAAAQGAALRKKAQSNIHNRASVAIPAIKAGKRKLPGSMNKPSKTAKPPKIPKVPKPKKKVHPNSANNLKLGVAALAAKRRKAAQKAKQEMHEHLMETSKSYALRHKAKEGVKNQIGKVKGHIGSRISHIKENLKVDVNRLQ